MVVKQPDKVRSGVVFTKRQYDWIRQEAYLREKSQAQIIRDLIDKELEGGK